MAFLLFQVFMSTWFPNLLDWLMDKFLVMMSKKAFPTQRKEWNLLPAPSVATTTPLIADEIYSFFESGFAEPVCAVQQIVGPKSVLLTDGRVLEDIDTIIYCTGYDFAVPSVPAEYNPYPVIGEPPHLYRYIFPLHPDPDVRNSLAFLGHCATGFPGFVQFELGAMAIPQVWRGKSPLPPLDEMKKWHEKQTAWRQSVIARSKYMSSFYVCLIPLTDYLTWMDETAGTGILEHFSFFSLKAWQFWWRDREFYNLCKGGLLSPAIWRLFDMGRRKPWAGAREQAIKDNKYADKRQQERLRMQKKLEEDRKAKRD